MPEHAGTGQVSGAGTAPQHDLAALATLLDHAKGARGPLAPSVFAIARCDGRANVPAEAMKIAAATAPRRALLAQAEALSAPTDATNGPELLIELRTAWSLTLRADERYLAWAPNIAAGRRCSNPDPDKVAADVLSPQAAKARQRFAATWNSTVASARHLPLRDPADL